MNIYEDEGCFRQTDYLDELEHERNTKENRKTFLTERLDLLRIIGALFLSNAVVKSIDYHYTNDNMTGLLIFWLVGVSFFILYYITVTGTKCYRNRKRSHDYEHKHHIKNSNNLVQQPLIFVGVSKV